MTASAPAASSMGLPVPARTRNQRMAREPSATPSTSGQSPSTYPRGEQSGGGGEIALQNLPSPQSDANRSNRMIAAHAATAWRPPETDATASAVAIVAIAESWNGRGSHASLGMEKRR